GEENREILVVGVAGVVRAEVRVAAPDRAAERLAVAEVAEQVAERARRPADRDAELHARCLSRARQPERTRSVSPPASSTRRASRAEPRIAVRDALIRRPRRLGANTTMLRSTVLRELNCSLYGASPGPKSITRSSGSAHASSITRISA